MVIDYCWVTHVIWIGTIFDGSSPIIAAGGGGGIDWFWATGCELDTNAGGGFYRKRRLFINFVLRVYSSRMMAFQMNYNTWPICVVCTGCAWCRAGLFCICCVELNGWTIFELFSFDDSALGVVVAAFAFNANSMTVH